MQIRNLHEKDVKQVSDLLEVLRKENLAIAYRTFDQDRIEDNKIGLRMKKKTK